MSGDPNSCHRVVVADVYAITAGLGLALSGIFVVLRLYTRLAIVKTFWWDDAALIFSWLLCAVAIGIYYACLDLGMGRPEVCLSLMAATKYRLFVKVSASAVSYSKLLARLSAALFVLRLFGISRGLRYFIVIWATFMTTVIATTGVLAWFQCSPVQGLWNSAIPATCWSTAAQQALDYVNATVSSAADLTMSMAPAIYMQRLHLPGKTRMMVGLLFAFSMIPFILAISLIVTAETRTVHDPIRDKVPLYLISSMEMSFLIICPCLPTLPPLVMMMMGQRQSRGESMSDMRIVDGPHDTPPASPIDDDLSGKFHEHTEIRIFDKETVHMSEV